MELIKKQHIGGIIYSNGGPVRQAKLDNELQANSKIPLIVGMDAEWGLSMRLDSTYAFPWNMTLGAIKDLNLIKKQVNILENTANVWVFISILHLLLISIQTPKPHYWQSLFWRR